MTEYRSISISRDDRGIIGGSTYFSAGRRFLPAAAGRAPGPAGSDGGEGRKAGVLAFAAGAAILRASCCGRTPAGVDISRFTIPGRARHYLRQISKKT
jgi:hypothetical protein